MAFFLPNLSPSGPPKKLPRVRPTIMTEPRKCLIPTRAQTRSRRVERVSLNSELS